ncbi:putative bifunctional diguanylate cyclase/phosphodiesterase [Alteribacter natronophilus]|uniref:putative bifunctional diguanylate cyclase/phosphodiesterase n=1 Tax=Alteribacter natronophilus TaxID=2583810 RepID=UPI00110E3EE4|nr:EAL domain-containing protein [Alteribacter natronophilus]TMW71551.1 EAL domain-containing protein [Alteribacter natronophilus]
MFQTFEREGKQNFVYFIERLNQTLSDETLFLLIDESHSVIYASPSYYTFTGFHPHQIEGSDYRLFELAAGREEGPDQKKNVSLLCADGCVTEFKCTSIPMLKDFPEDEQYTFFVYSPSDRQNGTAVPNPSWLDSVTMLPGEKAFRYVTSNNTCSESRVLCIAPSGGAETDVRRIRQAADELRLLQNDCVSVYYLGYGVFVFLCDRTLTKKERETLEWQSTKVFSSSYITPEASWHAGCYEQGLYTDYLRKIAGSGRPGQSTGEEDERRHLIESRLAEAVENQNLSLVYQPQVNLQGRCVSGVEALLRWEDELLGNVSPREFIPAAEASRLIVPAGYWVIEEACRQAVEWKRSGLSLRMSVNLSPVQCEDRSFANRVMHTVRESGIEPDMLTLEITENQLLYHLPEARTMLSELKDFGIRISIDDFGTGYSTFSYLKNFPVDTVKIDQSFIRDMCEHANSDDEKIVTTIIELARNLNMKVVAEGVEKGETLKFLCERQCDEIQGFLYCRPLPSEEVIPYLQADVVGESLFMED